MAFISLFDDRAKPKGTRDPLGFEMVWTYFGRKVVGNLTTITRSVNNFSVALLGFYWANEINKHIDKLDRHKKILETFLRYEQLANYLRYMANKKEDILGITRVRERIEDSNYTLWLSPERKYQILSNQTGYGLWGFYTTALQAADNVDPQKGLIVGNDRVPTREGEILAELIISKLDDSADDLYGLVTKNRKLDRTQLKSFAKIFMKAISDSEVRDKLVDQLMTGFGVPAGEHNIQSMLWRATNHLFNEGEKFENTRDFAFKIIESKQTDVKLKNEIEKIDCIERFLYTANTIFEYCQTQNDELVSNVVSRLSNHFTNVSYLPVSLPDSKYRNKDALSQILTYMHDKDWYRVVLGLLELNKNVMDGRGGAAWVTLEGEKLKVKVPDSNAKLIETEILQSKWRYNYFLSSYLLISQTQLGVA